MKAKQLIAALKASGTGETKLRRISEEVDANAGAAGIPLQLKALGFVTTSEKAQAILDEEAESAAPPKGGKGSDTTTTDSKSSK